jgi:RNA polymerase sigma factor (sigma-70 family)
LFFVTPDFYLFLKKIAISTVIHTDQRFITALLHNDTLMVREIYQKYAPRITHYIMANGGSEDDAADILQEALIDIYKQAQQKKLQLTCPFEPFLLLVCKRKWLNILKKRGRQPVTKDVDDVSIGEDVFAMAEQLKHQDKKMELFLQCFKELGKACQEIIQKCLGGEDQEKIAEQLKVSYGYLRKKKSECMASLTKMIHAKMPLT